MFRHYCSLTQVELGKIDAVGVQRKAQKVLKAPTPPLSRLPFPTLSIAQHRAPCGSTVTRVLTTQACLQLQEQAARITAELDAALGRPSNAQPSASAPAAAANGNNRAPAAPPPAGRQPIAAMSAEVVDSNPYSRLMALQRMGIVKDYERIRDKTVRGAWLRHGSCNQQQTSSCSPRLRAEDTLLRAGGYVVSRDRCSTGRPDENPGRGRGHGRRRQRRRRDAHPLRRREAPHVRCAAGRHMAPSRRRRVARQLCRMCHVLGSAKQWLDT